MCGFPRNKQVILLLALITVVACIIRFYHLDWQCTTIDEDFTIKAAGLPSLVSVILWSLGSDYNPPLYYVAAYISSSLLGGALFSIRLPAMIFGTLVIPAAYFLGKELRNNTLGMLMAITTSFFFPYVYYSQNARAYMLVMLAFIGFTIFFIRVHRGDTRYRTILLLSLFAVLCFWSHFYSIIPVVVAMCILSFKHIRILVLSAVTTIILCIPFIRYVGAFISHFSTIGNAVRTEFWFTPFQIAVMLPNELFCWSWVIVIPLAVLSASKTPINRDLFIISFVTAAICVFPMTYITSVSPRYALIVSPIVLLLALGILSDWVDRLDTYEKKISLFLGFVFVMFLFNYGSLLSWYTFNICQYV